MYSSTQAAEAVSARIPSSVLSRELLHMAGAVSLKVPSDARTGMCPPDGEKNEYVQFAQHVKGGAVNFFVHGDNPARFRGETVTAQAEIWQKTLSDGRSFLYVDLIASAADAGACRIMAMSTPEEKLELPEGAMAFSVLAPLVGCVVVAPRDTKIVVKAKVSAPPPAEPTPKIFGTGDSQLDRYLAAGWEISGEDVKEVRLKRKNGKGEEKYLTHQKPKAKKKKR